MAGTINGITPVYPVEEKTPMSYPQMQIGYPQKKMNTTHKLKFEQHDEI